MILLSREGRTKLEEELKRLKNEEMSEVMEMLTESRSENINENSEYDVAKENYDMLNIKISKIEQQLNNCKIIDPKDITTEKVQAFTSVRVFNHKLNKEQIFTIVSESEVELKQGKISYLSPIGSALINKVVGDSVTITVPAGTMLLEIKEIFIK